MADLGGEEAEYESDPEEAMLPLTMRRREASDDEEGKEEGRGKQQSMVQRVGISSDGESEGEGGAPAYDDEESEIEEEEEEEVVEEDEVEEVEEEREGEFEERGSGGADDAGEAEVPAAVLESGGHGQISGGESTGFDSKNEAEEEKKENEPFAVPTAGAFYMHDDRFRDSGGGRHRRTLGGQKLWESKDERKWGHDKFEEMNLQETHYDEGRRNSRGHYRGRGKNRGMDRGYARGNRSRAYDNGNNHNHTSRGVRGRGPRRYEPPAKNNNETTPTPNRQFMKSIETTSVTSSGRVSTHTSNVQSNPILPRRHFAASSLSSASPPFYPSGSSNQDISVTQKRDVRPSSINKNLPSSVPTEEIFSVPHSNTLLRGKTVADPISLDRLYIDESVRPVSGKSLPNLKFQGSRSSPIYTTQSPQSRAQGRGVAISRQLNYQPTSPLNQGNGVSPQTQPSSINPRPVQSPVQPLQASTWQLDLSLVNGSQASSPPKAASRNLPEPGESESAPGLSKSKALLVAKGKGNVQGSGRGSFLYSGAQVIGATGSMGVTHGDQSVPALLPVMQFGSQHPGGVGVPAVGMALPGYVARPGFGNSEMTWLPVLAGAAGALGASYCSPYFAVDGGYYARPSGQTSSLGVSGRETSTNNKSNNAWKPLQGPELVTDEFGQRQNKPRRYSEMNFGQ